MKRYLGIIFAMISASTFGLIPIFSIPALQAGLSVNNVLFWRFCLATIFLGTFLLVRKHSIKVKKDEFLSLAGLISLSGTTAFCLMKSYTYIPSGVATTIHFLYPVLVTLLMVAFFKERFTPWFGLAVVLAVSGVAAISGLSSGGDINMTGIGFALMTVLTYALYIVGINKTKASRMNSLTMTFYVMVMLMTFFFTLSMIDGGITMIPNIKILGDISLLALLPTLLSNFTLILAIKNVGSTTTAIMGCVEPVTAVLLGVLFLGEPLHVHHLIGIGLIIASVSFVILGDKIATLFGALNHSKN
ncbi:MAG: EamA family transporter [Bacteroidales bacterium]